MRAGDFGGHWFSARDVRVEAKLQDTAFQQWYEIRPVICRCPWALAGIFFALPSGDRKQVRLLLPSETRDVMNNYDDSFVTVVSVKGTPHDVSTLGGRMLGTQYREGSFYDLSSSSDGEHGFRDHRSSREIRSAPLYVFAVGQVNPGECSTAKGFRCHRTVKQPARPVRPRLGDVDTGMVLPQTGQRRFPVACGACSRRASR